MAYYLIGHQSQAVEFLERQRVLAAETGDRRSEASALTNLGEAYTSTGELMRAVELLKQAFSIITQMDDVAGEAKVFFNLALALEKLGDRVQASEHAQKALELFEIAKHPSAERVRRQLVEWQ